MLLVVANRVNIVDLDSLRTLGLDVNFPTVDWSSHVPHKKSSGVRINMVWLKKVKS